MSGEPVVTNSCAFYFLHARLRVRPSIRHSLRDGFTGFFALSPGIGLSCPRPRAMQSIVAS
jgi:hypothetical protein